MIQACRRLSPMPAVCAMSGCGAPAVGHLRDRRLNGFKFRGQAPDAPFIVDFVCIGRGLVIELDGSQHGDVRALTYDAADAGGALLE